MSVFGGHVVLGTEEFFQFGIVLRGKTSPQDNAEEQNEILLILSPRQRGKRGQNRIKPSCTAYSRNPVILFDIDILIFQTE